MKPAKPRPRRGHHAFRNQERVLMYLAVDGTLTPLSPSNARFLIARYGSVREAAAVVGIPKSTLHDCATGKGKL